MNIIKWRLKGWYMRVQLSILRGQLRRVRRKFARVGRGRRPKQLELPFRG